MSKSGYINGSDMLLLINNKPIGHCTSHTTTFTSETKDRAVKPVASASMASSMWKNKSVNGLSISIQGEGLRFYGETETGFKTLFSMWAQGQPIQVKCAERLEAGNTASPYLVGSFVITNLEEVTPAEDDATYSVTLENDGLVNMDAENLTTSESSANENNTFDPEEDTDIDNG